MDGRAVVERCTEILGFDHSDTRALGQPNEGSAIWAVRASVRLAVEFASTALVYAFVIRPTLKRELAHWHTRAGEIPDPTLRRNAHVALAKRGNMEGAALFAVLAPRASRASVVRMLVALQMAYTYLDVLGEQPSADPVADGRQLHSALLAALEPGSPHQDYYACHPRGEDGSFLVDLLGTCRTGVDALPSFEQAGSVARAAIARIIEFQSLNVGERHSSDEALERWASTQPASGDGLHWWETAAAGGSSLLLYATLALAADPELDVEAVRAIECAYHPAVGALHSLLDGLVDVAEDERAGQCNLLRYYPCPQEVDRRLAELAERARSQMRDLAAGRWHEVMLSLMVSHYLSAHELTTPESRATARRVSIAAGSPTSLMLMLFRGARLMTRSTKASR